jgi:hypothetical protein
MVRNVRTVLQRSRAVGSGPQSFKPCNTHDMYLVDLVSRVHSTVALLYCVLYVQWYGTRYYDTVLQPVTFQV